MNDVDHRNVNDGDHRNVNDVEDRKLSLRMISEKEIILLKLNKRKEKQECTMNSMN